MISNIFEEMNKLKNNAKVCIKRQKEIVKALEKHKDEILSNKEYLSEAKLFESVMNKVEYLNQKNFEVKGDYKPSYDNYVLDSHYTYWLCNNYDNTAYKKCYGKDYTGQYYFKFDEELLAKKLLGENITKKTIYLNIVDRINECTWYDENRYSCEYEDVYYPIKLEVYCDKNFDESKKYTEKQIKKLIQNKQIMVCDIELDKNNKKANKRLMNLGDCKYDFKLGKVEYKASDNVKVLVEDNLKDLKNSIIHIEELRELFYNYRITKEEVSKTLFDFKIAYPSFLQSFDETIKQSFVLETEIETQKIDFMKEYYDYSIKKEINSMKRELKEINKKTKTAEKDFELTFDEKDIEVL